MPRIQIIVPMLLLVGTSAMARHGGGHHGYCEHGCGYRGYYQRHHGSYYHHHWWAYRGHGFGEHELGHQ